MVRTRSTNYSPLVDNDTKPTEAYKRSSTAVHSVYRSTITERVKMNVEKHTNGSVETKSLLKNGISKSDKLNPVVYLSFFSLLIDLLAFTMILPLLPSLMEHYKQYDQSGLYEWVSEHIWSFQTFVGAPERFNLVLFGGFLGSMFSFLQFIVSPIIGGLSDVYGRKPLMLICLVGIAVSYLVWMFSYSFSLFVLARFIGGISKGNVSLIMAIISDVTNHNNRGKAMALVGIAFSLGFIIGPIIGAMFSLVADKSSAEWFVYPAEFALLLAIADLFFIVAFFKETLPKEKRASGLALSLSRALAFISVTDLFKFKAVQNINDKDLNKLKRLGHVYFVYLFIYSGLEFTLTFLTYHSFNYTSMQQGKMFFLIGIIMAVFQGGVVRRLPSNKNIGAAEFGLWIIPLAFLATAFASIKDLSVFGVFSAVHFLYVGFVLFAVSTAFVVSCLTTVVSQTGNPDQRGVIIGVFRSLGALARAFGPIVASIAYWSIGPFSTYAFGALCLLYPVLLLRFSRLK